MMVLLVILGILMFQSVMIGALSPYMSRQLAARCANCAKGEVYELKKTDSYGYHVSYQEMEPGDGHSGEGFFLALIWPLALPYLIASGKSNPSIKRGHRTIEAYWQKKELEESEQEMRELEARAGIGSR